MAELPVWDFFMQEVEGRGAKPQSRSRGKNAALLAEFLESDEPMRTDVREWLLGLFDPKGANPVRLVAEGRGRSRISDEIVGELRSGGPSPATRQRIAQLLRAESPAPRLECRYRRRGAAGAEGMKHWEAAEVFEVLTGGANGHSVAPSAYSIAKEILDAFKSAIDTKSSARNAVLKTGKLTRTLAFDAIRNDHRLRTGRSDLLAGLASLKAARADSDDSKRKDSEADH